MAVYKSKMELSNFNFQWTKTLYQNNYLFIEAISHSFLHFSRAIDAISYL